MLAARKKIHIVIKSLVCLVTVFSPFSICANSVCDRINEVSENNEQHCNAEDCFFPIKEISNEDIIIDGQVNWRSKKGLVLHTRGNVVFKKDGKIISYKNGSVVLKSGMKPGEQDIYKASVRFEGTLPQIILKERGSISIYYNPVKANEAHKYHNPIDYDDNASPDNVITSYMLINDIYDLQGADCLLSGNYALSQDIDASITKDWNDGQGFYPIGDEQHPFSGNFDGDHFSINNLHINRQREINVGLFGYVSGKSLWFPAKIRNLTLQHFSISGDDNVGALIGRASNSHISKINTLSGFVYSRRGIVGAVIGSFVSPNAGLLRGIFSNNTAVTQGATVHLNNNKTINNEYNKTVGACAGERCDCCAYLSRNQIEYCEPKCLSTPSGIMITNKEELNNFIQDLNQTSDSMFENTMSVYVQIICKETMKVCTDSMEDGADKGQCDKEASNMQMRNMKKYCVIDILRRLWEEAHAK